MGVASIKTPWGGCPNQTGVRNSCYSGNNTTFTNITSSNLIFRVNKNNGKFDQVIADYFATPANYGDSPAYIVDGSKDYFYALIENTTTAGLRRLEKIEKNSWARSIFSNNTTALSTPLRSFIRLNNGDFVISKSSALEYINASNARIGAPYINPTAAPCNTSTTLISKVLQLNNGNFVFIHAAASQNRIGIFSATGGTACLTAQAAPVATAFPSAMAYDRINNKLFVAYAGNSTAVDLNSIYAYDINETTNTISNPQKIYDANAYPATYGYLLYGVSEMYLDQSNNTLFVATAVSNATTVANYSIEKFRVYPERIGTANSTVLQRLGNAPFYNFANDTRCISGMFVGE
ncbi:MAG: hypothetical protein ACLGGX_10085 [Bdellovibrionia bacterium]